MNETHSPQSTYICRVQNSVWRLPKYCPPPHPLSTQRVCPPPAPKAGRYTLAGRWGGGGSIILEDARHWIGLLQYNLSTPSPLPPTHGKTSVWETIQLNPFWEQSTSCFWLPSNPFEETGVGISTISLPPPFSCGKCKKRMHTLRKVETNEMVSQPRKAPKCSVYCTLLYAWQLT